MKPMHDLVSWLLIIVWTSQSVAVAAVSIEVTSDTRTVNDDGILAFRKFGSRIVKWLEDEGLAEATLEAGSSNQSRIETARLAHKIKIQTDDLFDLLNADSVDALTLRNAASGLDSMATELGEKDSHFGPVVQRALLVLAAYNWSIQKFEKSSILLQQAILWHPHAKLPELNWILGEANFDLISFEAKRDSLLSRQRRQCSLVIKAPVDGSVAINGFRLGGATSYSVPTGASYLVEWVSQGYHPETYQMKCSLGQKYQWNVAIQETKGLISNSSARLIVDQKDGVFGLTVLSAEGDLTPIPLDFKISVRDVLESQGGFKIPLTRSRVADAMASNNLFRLTQIDANLGNIAQDESGLSEHSVSSVAWHRDWRLWAGAGVVVGAAVFLFLAPKTEIGSTQSHGLRINLD